MFTGGSGFPELFGGGVRMDKTTARGPGTDWPPRMVRLGESAMPEKRCSVRVAGLALAGAVSVSLALLIAERVVRPGVISEVQTPLLLGLVLLFVLPVLTFFAARQDNQAAVAEAVAESIARRAARRARTADEMPETQRLGLALSERRSTPDNAITDHGDEVEAGDEHAGRSIRHGAHDRVVPVAPHRGAPKSPAT